MSDRPGLGGWVSFAFLVSIISSWRSALTAPANGHFIQSFPLSDVELHDGTDFSKNEALNHEYLLLLDPDNLLYNFRSTAGLPAPGHSYGGWEGSAVEVRGQFVGHYLSALAFAFKSTGDSVFATRGDLLVQGLHDCQVAWGDGYLAAFPKSFIDRVEALQPVWAPYYVIHKIMAGLLAQHQLAGQRDALDVLLGMADYFCERSQRVYETQGAEHWHQVLETEFGGMNEVLYHLYMETGNERWSACAALFDKPVWYDALTHDADTFAGLHANTHLAQVNGFAARFEATGDPQAAAAVKNFFSIIEKAHSFSTGGSNWFEHWAQPRSLGEAVNNVRNH